MSNVAPPGIAGADRLTVKVNEVVPELPSFKATSFTVRLGTGGEPCGVSAPGLEILERPLTRLLSPSELREESVRPRFRSEGFFVPHFCAGDGILMRGDVLHRTFVTPEMTNHRTSIELRFFSSSRVPSRLKTDRFLVL